MTATFDAIGPSSAGAQSTTASISWTHTAGAGAGTVLVWLSVSTSQAWGYHFNSVTYGGAAMTLIASEPSGATSQAGGGLFLYGITGAAAGANTVAATLSVTPTDEIIGFSESFTGAAAFGIPVTGNSGLNNAVTTGTVSVTGTDAAGLVSGAVCDGSGGESWTAGTQRFKLDHSTSSGSGNASGATIASAIGTVSLHWSQTSDINGYIAVEVLTTAPAVPLVFTPMLPRRQGVTSRRGHGSSTKTRPPLPLIVAPPHSPAPRVLSTVSGSGTGGYFVDQYGQPIMFLAAEDWGLPANAGQFNGGNWQKDISDYLAARSAQGYTVLTCDPFGNSIHGGNNNGNTWDGVAPFTTKYNVFNETFWQRIDYLISRAADFGITVNLDVMYTYDFGTAGGGDGSGTLFTGMTDPQANAYGVVLGNRYKNVPNLIWFFGDDYSQTLDSTFTNVIQGIRSTGDTHLASIEYYSSGTTSHRDLTAPTGGTPFTWGTTYAQFNWVYYYMSTYYGIESAYADPNPLPIVWGDGFFYGDAGTPYDQQIMRNMVWWALSSGARGCTTGSDATFPWNSSSMAAVLSEVWSAQQSANVRRVFESLPGWWKLAPDTSSTLVTAGRGTRSGYSSSQYRAANIPDSYVSASYASDGSLALIYCQQAMSITVNTSVMQTGFTAYWVDPASGAITNTTAGSTYSSSGLGNNSAGNPDWVLVLQGPPVTSFTGSGGLTGKKTQASGSGTAVASFTGSGGATGKKTVIAGTGTETFSGSGGAAGKKTVATATGTETFSGSGGASAKKTAISGAGVTFYGSGGLAAKKVTAAGSGVETFSGSGNASAKKTALNGSGFTFAGSGGITAKKTAIAGTGTETFTGSGSAAGKKPSIAGAGSNGGVIGSGSAALKKPSVTAAGVEEFAGSGSPSAKKTAATATGTETFTGSGGLAAKKTVVSGSGTYSASGVTGSGSATSKKPSVSGSGSETFSASGQASGKKPAVTASGAEVFTGSGSVKAKKVAASGVGGYNSAFGSGGASAKKVKAGATGSESFASSGGLVLKKVIPSGAGAETITGSGGITGKKLVAFGASRTFGSVTISAGPLDDLVIDPSKAPDVSVSGKVIG